jgi:hypothetical protein
MAVTSNTPAESNAPKFRPPGSIDEQEANGNIADSLEALRLAFGLSPEEFAVYVIGTEQSTFRTATTHRLESLKSIKQVWEDQFEAAALQLWFRRPVPLFEQKTPLEMVASGRAEEVLHSLIRLAEGIPN